MPCWSLQENPSDKDLNQGTLVIFNLDPSVSNEEVRQIFGTYGEVKEVRMLLPNFVPPKLRFLLEKCSFIHLSCGIHSSCLISVCR